jgi:hypothetical protein
MRVQVIGCKGKFLVAALMLALFALTSPRSLEAQVAAGTIQGTVSDNSGAVLPNVEILIENLATGVAKSAITTSEGFFSVPNLLPGNYRVSATAAGFAAGVESDLSLAIGAVRVVNFALKVGSINEKVEVAGASPDVDTSTSQLSGVIGTRRINELPLNGRDWTQLATLEPGVSTIRTQQGLGNRVQQGEGTLLTVSGGRPWQNNYRLDGTSINDYANGAPGSALGTNLGVDAVQEFSVLTSNYPAEYGRSSGGIINAITRSGTNQFHGTAYEFLRNSALDTKNYFDSGKIPPFKRNQFGGSAGGPIRKDRTFIFGDYEGVRQSLGTTQLADVPTQAARDGQLSTGVIPTPDPAAVAFLNAFYPLPNGAIAPSGDTGQFSFTGQQITHENYFTTRVDHKISQRNSLFGTYVLDRADTGQPDELNNKEFGYLTRRQIATIEDAQTIGNGIVNAVRFGVNRVIAQEGLTPKALNPAVADLAFSSTPGLPAPQIQVPGLIAFSGGLGGFSQHFYHYTSYQASDDAFMTKGAQSIKFGISFERIQNNEFAEAAPDGLFKFGSLGDYLNNVPKSFTGVIPGKATGRGIRESVIGLYVQDDWRVRRNLTLNLGLRYEMNTVPTEVNGKLSTLRSLTDTVPHLGSPFFNNPTRRNFEPRVGFAWDPFGNSKTAVRGGGGFFDVLPLPYLFEIVSTFTAPFYEQGKINSPGQGSFPGGAFSQIAANSSTLRAGYVDPNPPRSYVAHWNLSVQQQLTSNLTAMIAYAGSRGIHQPEPKEDVDTVLPTLTPQGYLYPDPSTNPQRINENFGRIGAVLWNGDSYYHALEVKITKRMARNFQIQGSYTWSHAIDTGSTSVGSDAFGNSLINPIWFASALNRGPADFDLRHNLIVHYTWVLGTGKALPTAARLALGGWQLGGIVQASSGVPFNALLGGDPLGQLTSDNSALPDRLSSPGCGTLTNPGNPANYIKLQCFAFPGPPATPGLLRGTLSRNALFGPGLFNIDMSLFKNNYIPRISESFNLQLRIEAFNLFNHPNFAPPLNNSTVFDDTGNPVSLAGKIDSTQTPSRQIQFGLKAIW